MFGERFFVGLYGGCEVALFGVGRADAAESFGNKFIVGAELNGSWAQAE